MAIGNSNNTIKARVQLKSDTEANWDKAGPKENSPGFIPLEGELIVYFPNPGSSYNYSRLKIGDGKTNVKFLPFIDAGTVNGQTIPAADIIMIEGLANFPRPGDSTKLYIDTSENVVYIYYGAQYHKLYDTTFSVSKSSASNITSWSSGRRAEFSILGGRFSITTGTEPSLEYSSSMFVNDVTEVGGN